TQESARGAGKKKSSALPFGPANRPCAAAVGAAPRMKPHADPTSPSAPPRRGMSTRPGRVMLIAALLLLAIPLAVAVWGFGGYSAQRERNNADAQLARSLNKAG